MIDNSKLIESSETTLTWINKIESILKKRDPTIIVQRDKHYASVMKEGIDKRIVYIRPLKNQMNTFLPLKITLESLIQKTPSTDLWEQEYPSIFKSFEEEDIEIAVSLIFLTIAVMKKSGR